MEFQPRLPSWKRQRSFCDREQFPPLPGRGRIQCLNSYEFFNVDESLHLMV